MSNSGGLIRSSRPLNTGKLISAYYLEIEYLLERIEGATTHYQTLGVERSANNEEVILAYQKSVTVLHPSYHKVRAAVPDEMLVRVDKAFNKVSEAFSVLTNPQHRGQYDGRNKNGRSYSTVPLDEAKLKPEPRNGASSQEAQTGDNNRVGAEALQINVAQELRPVFTRAWTPEASVERRRCERFKLTVPVLVAGYDHTGGKWQEVTKTIDVSRIGVALRLRRRVNHGLVAHITLPLPTKLRSHGFSEAGYNMYAIVRRVEPLFEGMRVAGLEFIGARPPSDYLHKPWSTFRTQKWNGPERRREPRDKRSEAVAVEYLDETMQRISREAGVTEDVSPSGVRICVKAVPQEFEFVRVTSPNRSFNSLALVRNQWSGTDGFERLCLQFIDQKWPM
ncbi:MAG TPA: PilZ domain-containing protein [Blastocatellia bacterium]|nr:PilZ domain-containing protein [Blastocatellia bacterium]